LGGFPSVRVPDVRTAVRAALAGELIVLPTDTVYGLGTRPDHPEATARVFEAKRRPRDLELPVLVPSLDAAELIAKFDERAGLLARRFWPGPLTVVLRRTAASDGWDLGGDLQTIGVRMPRHPVALAVLAETGPLAVTSANISGLPAPDTCSGLGALFGDLVAAYLCEDAPLSGSPSAVVDVAHGTPRLLRAGAIEEDDIWRALGEYPVL
jgi:L-threonylcarbamoyladenylate synthase